MNEKDHCQIFPKKKKDGMIWANLNDFEYIIIIYYYEWNYVSYVSKKKKTTVIKNGFGELCIQLQAYTKK